MSIENDNTHPIYNKETTLAQQRILLALDFGASGIDRIAWETGYSPRHVIRIMRELEDTGALAVIATGGPQPTRYRLRLENLPNKIPFREWRAKQGRHYKKKAISPALRKRVFERDRYRCVMCDGWRDLSVDHIHPESKGGSLDLGNLQTLCAPCNSRKGTK